MRRIAHLSDLHFGTEDPRLTEGLLTHLADNPPDLVAVSGDLTQRAREREFRQARDFLNQLTPPTIVVPGNHDLPLYNLFHRVLRPLTLYQQYITNDLHPCHVDEELAVVGVNTARASTWKEGRISAGQVSRIRQQFTAAPATAYKVLVAHHPFVPRAPDTRIPLVEGAEYALAVLEECGCELILAGHLHQAYCSDVRPHHMRIKRSILVAQAGTAISQRRREEANAYNVIRLDGNELEIEVCAWDGRRFTPAAATRFHRDERGWSKA